MTTRVMAFVMALTFVGASTAGAASITINTNPGTTYTTSGVTDFSVNASQMNGLQITAFWTVNGGAQISQTQVWNSGVTFTGTNFDLGVSGDTFNNNAWGLDFNITGTGLLQRLVFNGVSGNTVFDRTNPSTGTVGSDQGKDLDGFRQYCTGLLCSLFGTGTQGNVTATYFNQVRVGANPFAGDIYAGLQIDFLSWGGLGEGSDWQFSLDTDIATAPLTTTFQTAAAVPEPGSMLLFGTGLLGLAAAARRRATRRS